MYEWIIVSLLIVLIIFIYYNSMKEKMTLGRDKQDAFPIQNREVKVIQHSDNKYLDGSYPNIGLIPYQVPPVSDEYLIENALTMVPKSRYQPDHDFHKGDEEEFTLVMGDKEDFIGL